MDDRERINTKQLFKRLAAGVMIACTSTVESKRAELNSGVQMTTELLHFYKNNPNIYWE